MHLITDFTLNWEDFFKNGKFFPPSAYIPAGSLPDDFNQSKVPFHILSNQCESGAFVKVGGMAAHRWTLWTMDSNFS